MFAAEAGLEEDFGSGLEVEHRVLELPGAASGVLVQVLDHAEEVVDAVADRREVELGAACTSAGRPRPVFATRPVTAGSKIGRTGGFHVTLPYGSRA
ncbi:hypothetical protein Sxan_77480 [Streptomyces xanthophaeus]|uniref:Uncharacterized protein n=1 Tax=Streptomyces xanthophaeus TaxID=67385 RepID=A0A919HA50_9ACTN|nr:hypothetical protein Sxan_77480 [Streptomyces xanthophaeus]